MKKIIILLSCVLLVAVTSNAQTDSSSHKTKKERIQNMDSTQKQNLKDKGITKENMKDLNLTKDQQKQIEEIHANTKKEKDKINNDSSLSADQKQEKIKQVEKDSKKKMNGILTDEQKQKIKNKRENSKP